VAGQVQSATARDASFVQDEECEFQKKNVNFDVEKCGFFLVELEELTGNNRRCQSMRRRRVQVRSVKISCKVIRWCWENKNSPQDSLSKYSPPESSLHLSFHLFRVSLYLYVKTLQRILFCFRIVGTMELPPGEWIVAARSKNTEGWSHSDSSLHTLKIPEGKRLANSPL
jgi:hypothetical protein